MFDVSLLNLLSVLPEIFLAVGALALLIVGLFCDANKIGSTVSVLSVILMSAVFFGTVISWSDATVSIFDGAYIADSFSFFMKSLILISASWVLIMSGDFFRMEMVERFEFYVLFVLATAGAMLMVSANDFIALYMGMELQSLALCVLASSQRESLRSTEAGLKYFVLGAVASGMMLYGISLLYGFSGTTLFSGIAEAAMQEHSFIGLVFGLVFLISGIAFKMSVFPFHMWTPDVYMGAPAAVTSFFATVPKIAAMSVLIRITLTVFPFMAEQWIQIVVLLSAGSMILGSFAAIAQTNIKRLVAYSSIGHMGFALVGLAAGSQSGLIGVLLYLTVYVIMTLGVFACIMGMRRDGKAVEDLDDLSGLASYDPIRSFLFAILAFSLAGIPPLLGFFAKFHVFSAAIEAKLYWLALIGVVTSVVGAFYYLRIVKLMYFDSPARYLEEVPLSFQIVLGISGTIVVFGAIFPRFLMRMVDLAAQSLF